MFVKKQNPAYVSGNTRCQRPTWTIRRSRVHALSWAKFSHLPNFPKLETANSIITACSLNDSLNEGPFLTKRSLALQDLWRNWCRWGWYSWARRSRGSWGAWRKRTAWTCWSPNPCTACWCTEGARWCATGRCSLSPWAERKCSDSSLLCISWNTNCRSHFLGLCGSAHLE